MVSNAPDTLWLRFNDFHDKFSDFFGFVSVFNCFVLETQRELDKKLGHYEYLLLRPFYYPESISESRCISESYRNYSDMIPI